MDDVIETAGADAIAVAVVDLDFEALSWEFSSFNATARYARLARMAL